MTRSQDPRNRSSLAASLDPWQVGALGRALQAHFDELLRAPLPPRFEALFAELEVALADPHASRPSAASLSQKERGVSFPKASVRTHLSRGRVKHFLP